MTFPFRLIAEDAMNRLLMRCVRMSLATAFLLGAIGALQGQAIMSQPVLGVHCQPGT